MRDITPYINNMSDHTKDRIRNTTTPHNINQDPFIANDIFVQQELQMHIPGYRQQNSAFGSIHNVSDEALLDLTPDIDLDSIDATKVFKGAAVLTIILLICIAIVVFMPFLMRLAMSVDAIVFTIIDTLFTLRPVAIDFVSWATDKAKVIYNVPSALTILGITQLIFIALRPQSDS